MSKVATCLWYAKDAEAAARLYCSLVPDSRIDHVQRSPVDNPGAAAGDVLLVASTLGGHAMQGLNGGIAEPYSNAASISVSCDDQAEVDRIWDGLIADGGKPIQCGWLNDRWRVPWQIVPAVLPRLLADPDPARAARAMTAMIGMVKLDIAELERAAG